MKNTRALSCNTFRKNHMIIADILLAKRLLTEGKLVAIPTETVYGLAANAFDGKAVASIYQVKNRPQFNPLIIHSNSLNRFADWGIFLPKEAISLAEKFSPGPITFVVKKSAQIPDIVSAGHETVAIRIPNHPKTLELLASLEFPLAAPSANLSGTVSPTSAKDVESQLGPQIAAVLEGGKCMIGLESTIISFVDGAPKLLRLGGLSIEAIENVLNQTLDKTMLINNENPQAPGMLSRHYAPQTPLYLDAAENHLSEATYDEMAFIGFSQKHPKIVGSNQIILSENGDYAEAAQNLFSAIRKADALCKKLIIAELLPSENLGLAINDRLKRAAVK